jgi:hypothetical protein
MRGSRQGYHDASITLLDVIDPRTVEPMSEPPVGLLGRCRADIREMALKRPSGRWPTRPRPGWAACGVG